MQVNNFFAERAEATAYSLCDAGLRARAAAADRTDRDAISTTAARLRAEVGSVHVFVHDAGTPAQGWGYAPFLESTPAQWGDWLRARPGARLRRSKVARERLNASARRLAQILTADTETSR